MKKNKNKNSSVFLDEEIDTAQNSIEEDISQSINIVNRNREELENERKNRINKFERNASGKIIECEKIRYKIDTKIIVFAFLAIVVITWILNKYGPIFGIHITSYISDINENKIELVSKESDIYGEYNNELFVYSNNSITTYDSNCKVTWTHVFSESFTPTICTAGKYMLVTNNSTGMIYLFENNNEILNKKIDGTIKMTFVDKYGNIAVEYSASSGYNNIIGVYDKKGNSKYDAYLSQDNIVSLKMLDSAEKMIVLESVTDSSKIGVRFRKIDISKKGDEQLTDIVALTDNFVYDFVVGGNDIFALLDNKIVDIDINSGNVEVLKEFDASRLLFVALNDNYYTYLERNIESDNYIVENIGYSGNKVSTTNLDNDPKSMISSDMVNYFIYQDKIHILNKWGVDLGERQTYFMPKKCVVFNNYKSLALIYTNKIYIVNL